MVAEEVIDIPGFHAGRREVLAEVYRRHVGRVERAVSCYCRGADAECVVHDVFVSLLERAEMRQAFGGGDLSAWLCTIARRRAIDHLRRSRRWSPVDDPRSLEGKLPPIEEEESLLHRDQVRHLEAALEQFSSEELPRLKSRLGQVFELRLRQRLSQVEAARSAGVPRATLIDRERRLMERLGRFLQRYFGKEAR